MHSYIARRKDDLLGLRSRDGLRCSRNGIGMTAMLHSHFVLISDYLSATSCCTYSMRCCRERAGQRLHIHITLINHRRSNVGIVK